MKHLRLLSLMLSSVLFTHVSSNDSLDDIENTPPSSPRTNMIEESVENLTEEQLADLEELNAMDDEQKYIAFESAEDFSEKTNDKSLDEKKKKTDLEWFLDSKPTELFLKDYNIIVAKGFIKEEGENKNVTISKGSKIKGLNVYVADEDAFEAQSLEKIKFLQCMTHEFNYKENNAHPLERLKKFSTWLKADGVLIIPNQSKIDMPCSNKENVEKMKSLILEGKANPFYRYITNIDAANHPTHEDVLIQLQSILEAINFKHVQGLGEGKVIKYWKFTK
jgi:hypothetical protein